MIVRSSILFAALCLAAPAHAEVTWSMPGSTCTWDEAASESKPLKIGLSAVQHTSSAKGTIVLNCPIPNYGPQSGLEVANWSLNLTYQDSTGTGPQAVVKAQLLALPLEGSEPADPRAPAIPATPGTPILITTASSDDSSATTINTVRKPFTFNFDYNNYTYWVHVELTRSGNQTAIFHAVFLEEVETMDE
jgi:hypothetical protein